MLIYDVNISAQGSTKYPSAAIVFPSDLGRALREKGYTRIKMEVRPEGILLIPYKGPKIPPKFRGTAEIPDW